MILKSKHIQVKEILEQELHNGKYGFGERLPTTRAMCRKYKVSDFVMTKAIKLLTEKGLLEAKVGSGIYSMVREPDIMPDPISQYNYDYSFSSFPNKKRLLIWVEDPLPFQINFWEQAFDDFSRKNIDIEIELRFGIEALDGTELPDMIISGTSYFNNSTFDYEDLMDAKLIKEFNPNLYEDMLLNPENLSYLGRKALFPIGFSVPFMLCHQNNWNPDYSHCSGYLDLFKTASRCHPGKIICDMRNITNSLITDGGSWINSETGKIHIQNPDKWQKMLEIYRNLYKKHKVIWAIERKDLKSEHERAELLKDKVIFREMSMADMHQYKNRKGIKRIPMFGDNDNAFTSQTTNAMILRHSMYPEECIRILSHFLSEDTQFDYVKSEIGLCIDKHAFSRSQYKEYLPRCRNLKNAFMYPPDKLLHLSVNEILIWEIYHYLCGMESNDILDKIERKISYFVKNIYNIPQDVFQSDNSKTLLSKYLIQRRQKLTKSAKAKELAAIVA